MGLMESEINEYEISSPAPHGIAINHDGTEIYTASNTTDWLYKIDINNAKSAKLSSSIIDRLSLNQDSINGMISGLEEIIELENPIGSIISEWIRPTGLLIKNI